MFTDCDPGLSYCHCSLYGCNTQLVLKGHRSHQHPIHITCAFFYTDKCQFQFQNALDLCYWFLSFLIGNALTWYNSFGDCRSVWIFYLFKNRTDSSGLKLWLNAWIELGWINNSKKSNVCIYWSGASLSKTS